MITNRYLITAFDALHGDEITLYEATEEAAEATYGRMLAMVKPSVLVRVVDTQAQGEVEGCVTVSALVHTVCVLHHVTPKQARGYIALAANQEHAKTMCSVHPSGECLNCDNVQVWAEEDAEAIPVAIANP
jgi:hypothetical protein